MTQYIQKIILPSGRAMEIMVSSPARMLNECPLCEGGLVYPISWKRSSRRWFFDLRCPDCHETWEDSGTDIEADIFDEYLSHGLDAIIKDYETLWTANAIEYINRFTNALNHDAIMPEDF